MGLSTFWIFLFLYLLSIGSCVIGPNCKPRLKFHQRVRTRGRTWDGEPCPHKNGCIQLPDPRQTLTRDQFEKQVNGINYQIMYRIDTVPVANLTRFERMYYVESGEVLLEYRGRLDGKDCVSSKRYSSGDYSCAKNARNRAISYSPVAQFFPPLDKVSPTYYFLSDCPSRYLLVFVCLDTETISNGYCNGAFFVEIGVAFESMSRPPYRLIEDELYKKLGLTMDDPFTKFLYFGERCPAPLTK